MRWLIFGAILCALLPVLCSRPQFPLYIFAPDVREAASTYYDGIVKLKIDDPLYDYARHFPPEDNIAKRNFRLTVPLIAHLTGTGVAGVHVLRFILQAVMLICLLRAAERACADRLVALAATLTIAGTYVGTEVWRDPCRWFDSCAHAFMAVALAVRNPWIASLSVLLGTFTDERTLLAVPLLIVFHLIVRSHRSLSIGIVLATVAYALIRMGLTLRFGLGSPMAGVGTSGTLSANIPFAPLAFWSALEGGWLLVAIAVKETINGNQKLVAAALAAATALPVVAAAFVQDFTRSASYGFPAILASLACLEKYSANPARIRSLLLWAAAISLLVPNIFILKGMHLEMSVLAHKVSSLLYHAN